MTLCIAAACITETGRRAVVVCSDLLATTPTTSSQTVLKQEFLGRYVGLYSGNIAESRELISFYHDYLMTHPLDPPDSLSISARLQQLREPLRLFKSNKVEDLVRRRLGISYSEFLDRRDQIESAMRVKVFDQIDYLTVEEELLIVSIVQAGKQERAFIFRQRMEQIETNSNFACIGFGAEAAEQSLHRREQAEIDGLAVTLYHVYEAKKMGEQSPTVGKGESVSIIEFSKNEGKDRDWSIRSLSPKAKDYLAFCYTQYGPQRVGEISLARVSE
jgi:hypothetical protein